MPAEVESMMYYGETPWHQLGTKMKEIATAEEAIVAAGLDWEVEVRPIYLGGGREITETSLQKAVVRTSDDRPLGIVGKRYVPLQNREVFDFLDPVVGEKRMVYHTAGSLKGGRCIWTLAKLPNECVIGREDVVDQYLLFTNRHDGLGTVTVFFTPVRVVCANTLSESLRYLGMERIRIRHTKNMDVKLTVARELLGLASQKFDEFSELGSAMIGKQLLELDLNMFLRRTLQISDGVDMVGRKKTHYDSIREVIEVGAGSLISEAKGTLWEAVNGVVEYADHRYVGDRGDPLGSLLWGGRRAVKKAAWEVAVGMLK